MPKLKPRLRQNSLRRMPLLANSATLAEPPLVYVAWALTALVLRASPHFNTDLADRTGVLVRRLRSVTASKQELGQWLSRESGSTAPVHIASESADLMADLKRGLTYLRSGEQKKKAR